MWGAINAFSDRIERRSRPATKPGAKIITLGVRDLYLKSNYQDFGRFQEVDLDIAGDGEATLPALTEAVQAAHRSRPTQRHSTSAARSSRRCTTPCVEQSKSDATIGWDASPITTARMCAEVYAQIKDEDWSLVGTAIRAELAAAAVGFREAASVERRLGRRRRRLQSAGLARRGARQQEARTSHASPSAATATSCSIPARCGPPRITGFRMLYIVHNNRAYHQEYMYLVAMASAARPRRRARRISARRSRDPNIDYATVARGMGVYGEGPITDPKELAPALARAIAVVKRGETALVDVVTDPR